MAKSQKGNKLRRALCLLIAVLMSVGGAGYTNVEQSQKFRLESEEALYVYAEDDENSGLVAMLNDGDEYKLLAVDEKWCKIEADDVEGFVLSEQLGIDIDVILNAQRDESADAQLQSADSAASDAEPIPEADEMPDAEPIPEADEMPDAEPAPEADEIPDAEPTPEADEIPDAEPAPEADEIPDAEPAPEADEIPDAEPTPADSATPDAGPDGDEIEAEYDANHDGGPAFIVSASRLNLRAAPSAQGEILAALKADTLLSLIDEADGYLHVRVSETGMEGYVLSEYVREIGLVEQASAIKIWGSAVVTAKTLNVRKSNTTSSDMLYRIKKGERVMLRSRSGDWYGIATSKGEGYVLSDYLEGIEVPGGVYKQGSKGEAVKEIQRRLVELGFLKGKADGNYGKSTKDAAAAFQRSCNISADGIIGVGTLNRLFAVSSNSEVGGGEDVAVYTTLKYGDSGNKVKALQERLRELGYMKANATGNFGSATKTALIDFQKKADIDADGIAGQSTQAALFAKDAPAKEGSAINDTLKIGDRGDAVADLQKRLVELGYLSAETTGVFGEATKAAVSEFQSMAGLTSDGVAGIDTMNALFSKDAPLRVDTSTLRRGDRGDSVKALQKRLIDLGYLSGKADGYFGSGTASAVKDLQKAVGISADGIAGSATITALFSASAPRKPDGTLKYGDRGDMVVDLQKRLRELGYLTDRADGIFGDTTETAIKDFQKAIGFTTDGVANLSTLKRLNASDAPEKQGAILREGDKGDAVKSLQKRLIELGYMTGRADGRFGGDTQSALKAFQRAVGLKDTGVADIETQDRLNSSDAPEMSGTTLREGDEGESVRKLQKRLIELGYMTASADGNFSAATKAALISFQQVAGLDADGIAGSSTQAELYSDEAPRADSEDATTLKTGSSGEAVKKLQKRLIELGYMTGRADGNFGSATKAAVKLFQKQLGITVDGVAGLSTQNALYASDAPEYDGDTSVDVEASSTAEKIINTAKKYLGCPYVYGTSGPNTFDCSGFTQFVFKKYGYSLLRSALQQGYNDNYTKLTRSQLRMGDIVCFNTISDNDLSDHVGIYISDGNFIQASSGGGCVMISNLDSGYYNRVFSWGRRILD